MQYDCCIPFHVSESVDTGLVRQVVIKVCTLEVGDGLGVLQFVE